MKLRQSIYLKFAFLFLLACTLSSSAQTGTRIEQLNQDALDAMRAGNWEEAHKILITVTDGIGHRDIQSFGPRLGWCWYHRGYCETKLDRFEDAMKSFKKCYIIPKNVQRGPNQPAGINMHQKKSLLMWGHAAKGAGQWATSIRMYKKFLAERDPTRDRCSKEEINLNMATNYYMLRKIAEGDRHLDIAISIHDTSHSRPRPPLPKNQLLSKAQPSPSIEQVLVSKARILRSLERETEAKFCYLQALALAEKKQNSSVASECLFELINLLSEQKNPPIKEIISHYDHFWSDYGNNSPFNLKVAAAGIPAMRKVGRIDEALQRIQSGISTVVLRPGVHGLKEAIDSFTDEYLKDHTPKQLSEYYSNFHGDRTTHAILRSVTITAYEHDLNSKNRETALHAKAIIQVLYKELRNDFALKDLSNFTLIELADYLREQSPNPQTSQIYYEELLSRPKDSAHHYAALLGLAKLNAKGDQDQKAKAINQLRRVIDDSAETAEQEEALYLTASLHLESGEYDRAISSAKQYLSKKRFRRYQTHCRMLIATAHDKAGRIDDALAGYQNVWIGSSSKLSNLHPVAMHRWMELLWKRNGTSSEKSDRQIAYEGGHKFLTMTGLAFQKATLKEKATWDKISKLVSTYAASPDTKTIPE